MQPLVIVLEGPDGAGKTTYADLLIAKAYAAGVDTHYIHNGPDDADRAGNLALHYRDQMLLGLTRANTITIIDRSFLSEMVYGRIFRGESRVTTRQMNSLQKLPTKFNIAFVGITADEDLRRERILARGEHWDPGSQAAISEAYANHFHAHDYAWTKVEAISADTEGNE